MYFIRADAPTEREFGVVWPVENLCKVMGFMGWVKCEKVSGPIFTMCTSYDVFRRMMCLLGCR